MKLVTLEALPTLAEIGEIYGVATSQSIKLIVNQLFEYGVTESNQISYVLATAKHESFNYTRLNEMYNGDPVEYFNNKYGHRTDLGNRPETNDGYDYRGRGFVQITGRSNYEKMGELLKIDLLKNPDLAATPEIAAKILAYGMKFGSFTGKKLSDYINENNVDYINARKIINGIDQAALIEGYAKNYDNALENGLRKLTLPISIVIHYDSIDSQLIAGNGMISLKLILAPTLLLAAVVQM